VFARHVDRWLADETAHADDLALAARYAAWALHAPAGNPNPNPIPHKET